MLNTLLSEDMEVEEKGKRLSEDYDIEINEGFGEELEHMCNLGEGIREDALEEGISVLIETCQEVGLTKEETMAKIKEKCKLASSVVEDFIVKYWK